MRWFASEGGKHYRGHSQDMEQVFQHVRHKDDLVNSAPAAGNRNGWEYVGSIPFALLIDWLKENNLRMDQWARDEDNCKKRFMAHLQQRQYHKLLRRDWRRTLRATT